VFVPTLRLIAPDALPEVTAVPLTATVANTEFVVGVMVSVLTLLVTVAV